MYSLDLPRPACLPAYLRPYTKGALVNLNRDIGNIGVGFATWEKPPIFLRRKYFHQPTRTNVFFYVFILLASVYRSRSRCLGSLPFAPRRLTYSRACERGARMYVRFRLSDHYARERT